MTGEYPTDAAEVSKTPDSERPKKKLRRNPRKVKQPLRGENGKPRVLRLVHAGSARGSLLKARFRVNSKEHELLMGTAEALVHHAGGAPTAVQARVIDHAARLRLIAELCWAEIVRSGPMKNGKASGAFDAFLRAVREERAALLLLGVERRTKPLPDLSEYLAVGSSADADAAPGQDADPEPEPDR